MKNLKMIIAATSIFLLITSCQETQYKEKDRYETGHFKEFVVNFEEVNTEYDDYNSTAPFIHNRYLFHFSSNRNSLGDNYDIVGGNIHIYWDKYNGTLTVGKDIRDDERFKFLKSMLDTINTSYNELGPYSVRFRDDVTSREVLWTDFTMFANDSKGNYDIKFTYREERLKNNQLVTSKIKPVQNIEFLNSSANDLYPTFYGDKLYNSDNRGGMDISKIEKMLFCSDRDGKFDLYSVNLPNNVNLIDILKSKNQLKVNKIDISSGADDKCPFVNGKFLVFASNRAGGYGGFDLYYSQFKNGKWTEPKNFGDKINTEYDEYRPIVLESPHFDNNLMIFSSNRPEGKGGFDLYYVGINRR